MDKGERVGESKIEKEPDNQVVAEGLSTGAKQVERWGVGEGVESQAEADVRFGMGVDCVQGYHFGVPKFSL